MIFIKNSKLFVIILLKLMSLMEAGSVSVSQMGDVRIEKSESRWLCDKIECPLDADRCYVSKSNDKSPSVLERVNICYARDGQKLKENIVTTSIDPGNTVNIEIISFRHGGITSFTGINGDHADFDEQQFREELDRNLSHMHANLNREMHNLHQNLNQMNKNLHNNLQNQMQNLNHNLKRYDY